MVDGGWKAKGRRREKLGPDARGARGARALPIRPEEEADVEVGGAFADDLLDPFAVAPPMGGVVVGVWHRDDADFHIIAEGFLKEEPRTARVNAFGEDVEPFGKRPALRQPVAEGEGGAVGAVPIFDPGGDHLEPPGRQPRSF